MDEDLHELAERSRRREIKECMEREKKSKLIIYTEKKVFQFKNNRICGIILTLIGIALAIIGSILAIIHGSFDYLVLLIFGYLLIGVGKTIMSNSEKVGN